MLFVSFYIFTLFSLFATGFTDSIDNKIFLFNLALYTSCLFFVLIGSKQIIKQIVSLIYIAYIPFRLCALTLQPTTSWSLPYEPAKLLGFYDVHSMFYLHSLLLMFFTVASINLIGIFKINKSLVLRIPTFKINKWVIYMLAVVLLYFASSAKIDYTNQVALREYTNNIGIVYYMYFSGVILLGYRITELRSDNVSYYLELITIIFLVAALFYFLQRREILIPILSAGLIKLGSVDNIKKRATAIAIVGAALACLSFVMLILRTDSDVYTNNIQPLLFFSTSEFWIVDMALLILSDGINNSEMLSIVETNFNASSHYMSYEQYFSQKYKEVNLTSTTPGFWVGASYAHAGLVGIVIYLLLIAIVGSILCYVEDMNNLFLLLALVVLYFFVRNGQLDIALAIFVKISIFLTPIVIASLLFSFRRERL